MSESREKKRRYIEKLQYLAALEKWLAAEPPIIRFVKWRKWKNQKPKRTW